PLNYSDAHLDDAKHSLTSLYNALGNVAPAAFALSENANDYTRRFYAAMDDDFDTVKAVAVLFELAKEINKTQSAELSGCLKALAGVLGLLQREPHEFLQSGAPDNGLSADAIEALIAQRNLARANKNWAESDRIRDELAAQGVVLRDAGGETTWTRE
ncbi:MAG: cysteine--tRNA ligase, partial [Kingella sp. (in: b-proteobacteria)]